MNQQDILQTLSAVDAVLTNGHFVYKSWRHGSDYINKDALSPHPWEAEQLCKELASRVIRLNAEVVVCPAIAAIVFAYSVARILDKEIKKVNPDSEVNFAFADKEDGSFVIKRGYGEFIKGKRVLVVEDILTTGGSAKETVDVVRSVGGHVVAVAAICNRGGVTVTKEALGVPELISLVDISLDSWDEAECPLCAQGLPVNTEVGHGREFLARKEQRA